MVSSRHPFVGVAVELAIKVCKKYPVNVSVVAGTFFLTLTLAKMVGWTWGTVFLMTALALPSKLWVVDPMIWTFRYRRLLASESLPFPGRRAAGRFRRREKKRMKNTRAQFAAFCSAHGLTNAAGMSPMLRNLTSLVDGSLTCEIYPGAMAIKGGVPKFQKLANDIAAACGANGGLRVKPFGVGGVVETSAPSAARLTFFFEKQVWPTLPIQQLPDSPPGRVSVGNDEDLKPATMPLVSSMLLVAMTGKGKSKAIWTLLIGISLKVRNRLFAVDPKGGQEMSALKRALKRGWIGNRLLEDYASDSEAGAYRVIMAAEAAMKKQQEALAERGISEWKPQHAAEFPLIVLVLDEMLEFLAKITAMNKPGKAAEQALLTILSQGRAAGCKVIMASQASDKEILGNNRTLIASRLVLGTENPTQTGMAFGDMRAEEYGATCSQIDEPGIAFIKIDGVRGYRKVRIALVDDHDIADFVDVGLPSNMGVDPGKTNVEEWRPQWLYCYLTREDCVIDGIFYPALQCAYIGVTTSPGDRHAQHVKDYLAGDPKHAWMAYVDIHARPIVQYAGESRVLAEEEEQRRIAAYNPIGNIMENRASPWFGQGAAGVPVELAQSPGWLERHGLRRPKLGIIRSTAPVPVPVPVPVDQPDLEPEPVVLEAEPVVETKPAPPKPAGRELVLHGYGVTQPEAHWGGE